MGFKRRILTKFFKTHVTLKLWFFTALELKMTLKSLLVFIFSAAVIRTYEKCQISIINNSVDSCKMKNKIVNKNKIRRKKKNRTTVI